MLEMRKRQKMQRLHQQNAATNAQPQARPSVNLNTCDLGNSPNLQPRVTKPYKVEGRFSPLQNARQSELV